MANRKIEAYQFSSGSDYSPDKFYTRSVSKDKDSQVISSIRVPTDLYAQVHDIVFYKHFPQLKSMQDLIRDAIYHRVKYLNGKIKDGKIEQALDQEAYLVEVQAIANEMQNLEAIVKLNEATLEQAMEMEDVVALQRAIDRAEQAIDEIREPYNKRLRELLEKYGKVLNKLRREQEENTDERVVQ